MTKRAVSNGPVTGEMSRISPVNSRPQSDYVDQFGMVGPRPVSDGQRQPLSDDDPTGPELGALFPDFLLPRASGGSVSFHQDRGGSKAAVVFFRSAVW